MAYYYVESIGKGKKKGIGKEFTRKSEAIRYASGEVARGKGVSVDRVTNTGQSPIAQKNMKITGLGKGKYGKEFVKDFGSIPVKKRSTVRKTSSQGFGFGWW